MSSFDPNLTIGAVEVGVLISYVLFGVTTTQAYIYYGRFPEDSWRLKLLARLATVAFVWFCELAHAICIGHSIYVITVSDYGHPERLVRILESSMVAVFFSAAIAASESLFTGDRAQYKDSSPSGYTDSQSCCTSLASRGRCPSRD
ncbi:hypothetical protein DFH09DRAFT_1323225 [Mycena vulgaris]|nr:hypothetical protein DFH09DRAFT_1323225 [Mycena vulgaris]